jgi:hypothetical protein
LDGGTALVAVRPEFGVATKDLASAYRFGIQEKRLLEKGRLYMLILIIILVLLLGSGGGYYGHSRWGYGGGAGIGLGTILIVVLIVYMLGGFR